MIAKGEVLSRSKGASGFGSGAIVCCPAICAAAVRTRSTTACSPVRFAFFGKPRQVVAVVPGRLLMPVEAAVVTMAAEAPDKPAGGLRPVDLAVNNRLHNGVQLIRRQQAKLADEIDFCPPTARRSCVTCPGWLLSALV